LIAKLVMNIFFSRRRSEVLAACPALKAGMNASYKIKSPQDDFFGRLFEDKIARYLTRMHPSH